MFSIASVPKKFSPLIHAKQCSFNPLVQNPIKYTSSSFFLFICLCLPICQSVFVCCLCICRSFSVVARWSFVVALSNGQRVLLPYIHLQPLALSVCRLTAHLSSVNRLSGLSSLFCAFSSVFRLPLHSFVSLSSCRRRVWWSCM